MLPPFIIIVSLSLPVCAFAAGMFRWRQLSRADKWLCFLMLLAVIQEFIAYMAARILHNNLFTYHVYNPLELLVICFYFNESIDVLKVRHLGIGIGLFGVLLSLFDTLLLQPVWTFNSFFLMYEGFCIILFCLLAFYRILIKEDESPLRKAHFWITVCLLVYWSCTYTSWGLYTVFQQRNYYVQLANMVIFISNLLFYAGISILFLRYLKLKPSGG